MTIKNETYKVKDLYEAAFLYATGVTLLGLEKAEREFYFIFTPLKEAEIQRDLYWSKQGSIAPKTYSEAIRSLKDYIFSKERY